MSRYEVYDLRKVDNLGTASGTPAEAEFAIAAIASLGFGTVNEFERCAPSNAQFLVKLQDADVIFYRKA